MGEFEIACKNIAGWADAIRNCSKEIKRQQGRAADVLRQLRTQEESRRDIEQALSEIVENLYRQQAQVKQYGDVLKDIVMAYKNTEAGIRCHIYTRES